MISFSCDVNSYHFKSLTERRVEFDVTFIYKLLNNNIVAPDLSSKLSLAISYYFYSRNPQTFKTNFHASTDKHTS